MFLFFILYSPPVSLIHLLKPPRTYQINQSKQLEFMIEFIVFISSNTYASKYIFTVLYVRILCCMRWRVGSLLCAFMFTENNVTNYSKLPTLISQKKSYFKLCSFVFFFVLLLFTVERICD